MPRRANFLCIAIAAALPLRLAAAGAEVSENVPVTGTIAAMAASLGIAPVPERARFVAEVARLTHQAAEGKRTTRARAASTLALGAQPASSGPADLVPIPLTVALWSKAIFKRPVAPAEMVAAIVADPRAAHLCYGLAALDDETLQFLSDHPDVLTRLYERAAAVFAAFGGSLRIQGGRVAPPGGKAAADLWEQMVGEKLDRPEGFVRALYEAEQGRLAYLYDTIAGLDAPHATFALGLSNGDSGARVKRFKALAAVNRAAIPQWQPSRLPFTRPLYDVASLLSRVHVRADGSAVLTATRPAWRWAFENGDLPPGAPRLPDSAGDEGEIDAAWLAQMVAGGETRDRADRLDQLAFAQRVFGEIGGAGLADALVAIRAFPRYRMLLVSLEGMGVRDPAVYAAAARRAQQLTNLESRRAALALAQYQGALALLARMARAHTLDAALSAALVKSLADVSLNDDGRYAGAVAKWLQQDLRPALLARLRPDATTDGRGVRLQADLDLDALVLSALAGPRGSAPSTRISWEGQTYRLDLAASEEARLRRVLDKQGNPSLEAAVAKPADESLAEILVAWAYAISIADADSPVLLTGNVMRRHDFGFGPGERGLRTRAPWALPRQEIAVGTPWHVTGSLLGLDVALASLALRRVNTDRVIDAPTMSTNERDAFAAAVALMNPYDLTDAGQNAIVEGVARGRARVASLAEDSARMAQIANEITLDGWRRRALQWTIVHEPQEIGSMFSLTELLYLGRARVADLHPWGMSALGSSGCLCTRLAPPSLWRSLLGRPQLGLMAATVADLNLHMALMLHQLKLPAAVARSVLTAAVQDFIDEARPTDFNDWLTLVRTAQAVPVARVEDYVAAVTAHGPLIPMAASAGP